MNFISKRVKKILAFLCIATFSACICVGLKQNKNTAQVKAVEEGALDKLSWEFNSDMNYHTAIYSDADYNCVLATVVESATYNETAQTLEVICQVFPEDQGSMPEEFANMTVVFNYTEVIGTNNESMWTFTGICGRESSSETFTIESSKVYLNNSNVESYWNWEDGTHYWYSNGIRSAYVETTSATWNQNEGTLVLTCDVHPEDGGEAYTGDSPILFTYKNVSLIQEGDIDYIFKGTCEECGDIHEEIHVSVNILDIEGGDDNNDPYWEIRDNMFYYHLDDTSETVTTIESISYDLNYPSYVGFDVKVYLDGNELCAQGLQILDPTFSPEVTSETTIFNGDIRGTFESNGEPCTITISGDGVPMVVTKQYNQGWNYLDGSLYYYEEGTLYNANYTQGTFNQDNGDASLSYTLNPVDQSTGGSLSNAALNLSRAQILVEPTEENNYRGQISGINSELSDEPLTFDITSIEKIGKTVTELIVGGSFKEQYYVGDDLDLNGIVITARYSDDTSEDVTDYCSFDTDNFNSSEPGQYVVQVSYESVIVEISLQVVEKIIESIEISGSYKNEYLIGEEFDPSGIIVTVHYSDGSSEEVGAEECEFSQLDSSSIGEKSITVTYSTASETIMVFVNKTLEEIRVSGDYKTEYYVGEEFDRTGLIVTAYYSDGSDEDVTSQCEFSDYDLTEVGEKTITVSYEGLTDTIIVTVMNQQKTLTGIRVSGDYQTEYNVGDQFNEEGFEVTAIYSDGTEETITAGLTFEGFDSSSPGIINLSVIYEDQSEVVELTIVEVSVELSRIEVSGEYKTNYFVGDEFVSADIIVTAYYSDESDAVVTDYTEFTGFNSSVAGECIITATYEGISDTFTVYINDPTPLSIEVRGDYKLEYDVGDQFDTTNLQVIVIYDSGESLDVTKQCTFEGFNSENPGVITVTIRYEELTTSIEVTINEVPVELLRIEASGNYKTEYYVGDSFDPSELSVVASYSDGSSYDVTSEVEYRGFDSESAGEKTVYIVYEDAQTSITVNVLEKQDEPELEYIEISQSSSYKTAYEVGEEFDTTGIIVFAYYSNGESIDVTQSVAYSGFNSQSPGDYKITITYEDHQAEFMINVAELPVVHEEYLEISGDFKSEYLVGEEFDKTGLIVILHDVNGETIDVTNECSFEGFSSEQAGRVFVIVTYRELSTEIPLHIGEVPSITPEQMEEIIEFLPDTTGDEERDARNKESLEQLTEQQAAEIIDVVTNTQTAIAAEKKAAIEQAEAQGDVEKIAEAERIYQEKVEIIETVAEASVVVGAAQQTAEVQGEEINNALPEDSGLESMSDTLSAFYQTQMDYLLGKKTPTRGIHRDPVASDPNTVDFSITKEEYSKMIDYVDTSVPHMKQAALQIRKCSNEQIKVTVKNYITKITTSSFRDFDKDAADEEFARNVYQAILLHMQEQVINTLEQEHQPSTNQMKEAQYQEELAAVKDIEEFEIIVSEVLRERYNALVTADKQIEDLDKFHDEVYWPIFRAWALDIQSPYDITLEELTAATIEATSRNAKKFEIKTDITKSEVIFFIVLGGSVLLGIGTAIALPTISKKRRYRRAR